VIAVDAGFLYALADRRDAAHDRAMAWRDTAPDPGWVTTWPVLGEACHLLAARLGPPYAAALLDDVAAGVISVWEPGTAGTGPMAALMRKYAHLPMDLADATLVLLAEHLGHGRILTTDRRDFGAYRWKGRRPFHNLMEAPR
jgi:predicted nucleic acid-binding protein